MSYVIEELRQNPNAYVQLSIPGQGQVLGFPQSEMSIDGQSTYGTLFEDLVSIKNTANNLLSSIEALFGWQNRQLKSFSETMATWASTNKLQFSLSLLFLNIEEEDDPRWDCIENAKKLLSTVYPTSQGWGVMTAPLGYNPDVHALSTKRPTASNTITAYIGQYLVIPELVATQVSCQYSRETFPGGKPIHATATIALETFRVVMAEEVRGYFRK